MNNINIKNGWGKRTLIECDFVKSMNVVDCIIRNAGNKSYQSHTAFLCWKLFLDSKARFRSLRKTRCHLNIHIMKIDLLGIW